MAFENPYSPVVAVHAQEAAGHALEPRLGGGADPSLKFLRFYSHQILVFMPL